MPVHLKFFDARFRKSDALRSQFDARLMAETAQPKVWTKSQVEDLTLLSNAVSSLWEAVSQMANEVRDDWKDNRIQVAFAYTRPLPESKRQRRRLGHEKKSAPAATAGWSPFLADTRLATGAPNRQHSGSSLSSPDRIRRSGSNGHVLNLARHPSSDAHCHLLDNGRAAALEVGKVEQLLCFQFWKWDRAWDQTGT
jgi:hypothetical protein